MGRAGVEGKLQLLSRWAFEEKPVWAAAPGWAGLGEWKRAPEGFGAFIWLEMKAGNLRLPSGTSGKRKGSGSGATPLQGPPDTFLNFAEESVL